MGCGGSTPANKTAVSVVRVNKPDPGPLSFKIVMIGNTAVGKSSLVVRYTKDEFYERLDSTVGAAFSSELLPVMVRDRASGEEVSKEVKLNIWDTAGEEMYRSMTKSFFRNANAALLVFDVTEAKSFAGLKSWIDDFRANCPTSGIFLVGNKIDLADRRVVSSGEAEAFVGLHSLSGYYEVSARTKENVQRLFVGVAQSLADGRSRRGRTAQQSEKSCQEYQLRHRPRKHRPAFSLRPLRRCAYDPMWNCKLNHCQECSHTIRWVVYQRRLMASLSASFQSQSGSMIKVDTSYGAGAPLGSTSPSKFGMESPTKLATGSLLKKTFVGALQPTLSRSASNIWKHAERPGPGSHHHKSSFGSVADSRKASSRTAAPQKGPREHGSFWVHTCTSGPKYSPLSSVGSQVTSARTNSPSFGFGTASRDATAKVYGRS